jgi:hypothetical protein
MAAKRRKFVKKTGPVGPRGPRGTTGRRGPKGPAGSASNHAVVVALSAQMEQVLKELQVQLTRIAQIQAQLDHLAVGHAPEPLERRATKRTSH